MGKKKAKKDTYASINEKLAATKWKKIDALMDELKALVGKQGDGINGGSKTLIGAIEGCNNEAYDGSELTNAYNYFNNTTLKVFNNQIRSMDSEFNVIDKLAK